MSRLPSSRRTSSIDCNERTKIEPLTRGCNGRRPQFRDQPQNVGEDVSVNCDFGHLESDIAPMADDLRADLNQLFLQARQRPILDRFGRRQRAQEVAEIVGECIKLKANGVGGEGTA